jgi:hypothetical protein
MLGETERIVESSRMPFDSLVCGGARSDHEDLKANVLYFYEDVKAVWEI